MFADFEPLWKCLDCNYPVWAEDEVCRRCGSKNFDLKGASDEIN